MATVIPKQPKKEREQITIRLDREVLQALEHYCRYLESGRDYVINQFLTFIFRKDKPFSLWLSSQRFPFPEDNAVLQLVGAEKPVIFIAIKYAYQTPFIGCSMLFSILYIFFV